MWGITPDLNSETVSEYKGLNEPTEIFDSCGAYNVAGGAVENGKGEDELGAAIRKGSKFTKWDNALKFLEWYGIPYMDGFGIVIIDNLNPDKYATLNDEGENCFNSAKLLNVASITAAFLVYLSF
jgi:hypothetical protein